MRRLALLCGALLPAISFVFGGGVVAADDAKYWDVPLVPFEAGSPPRKYWVGTAEISESPSLPPKVFYFWFSTHPDSVILAEGIVALWYLWAPASEVEITEAGIHKREVRGYGKTPWYRLLVRKGDLMPASIKTFKPPVSLEKFPPVKPASGLTDKDGLLDSVDLVSFSVPADPRRFQAGLVEEKKGDETRRGYYFFRWRPAKTQAQGVYSRLKGVAMFEYRYVPEREKRFVDKPLIVVTEGYPRGWCGAYIFPPTYRLRVPKGAIAPAEIAEILPPRELPDEERAAPQAPPK